MANLDHSTLTDPKIHEPKGVASAAVNTVYVANGAGSGSWTTPPSSVTNQVIVNSASDFPAAVSGVITLAANTAYLIDGAVNIGSDRIVLSNNTYISGLSQEISSITSTTTGALFTSTSNFIMERLTLSVASGTVFSCSGTSVEQAWINYVDVSSATGIGTFTAWGLLFWFRSTWSSFTNPLVMSGTCGTLLCDQLLAISGYIRAVDISSATFSALGFVRCGFFYASATAHVKVAVNSGNFSAGDLGRISLCKFVAGPTYMVENFTRGDLRWQAATNIGLGDSAKDAEGYMHISTVTTIGAGDGDSGNPKLVNGSTNWVDSLSDQFTISTGGRFTYIGDSPTTFMIQCNITGTTTSGTDTINHYLAKNGTVITASKTQTEYTSTATASPAPCTAIVELDTNDYIELYVENSTGTNNWQSDILNMTIR